MAFQSQTYGKLNIRNIPEKIMDYVRRMDCYGLKLTIMTSLVEELEKEEYREIRNKLSLAIHVDASWNDHGKTKELIPGLIGWIRACGYDCKVKPESYAASSIADRISK